MRIRVCVCFCMKKVIHIKINVMILWIASAKTTKIILLYNRLFLSVFCVTEKMSDLVIYPVEAEPAKFSVIGLVSSVAFQKSRFLLEKLHASYPKKYDKPEIRQMLNVDWQDYIIKMRRRHGKRFYLLKKPMAVFLNGELLGDDEALWKLITKSYIFELSVNFEDLINCELRDYLNNVIENKKRDFVYFTISIENHVAGSFLFMLYNDLVPITCKNFVKRCSDPVNGYKGQPIQRIVDNGWIQCGGWELTHREQACENYMVPHNRRGVLSMSNAYKHNDNSTQFFITLQATPWMDYKYVAFGQLMHGADLLSTLESVPTYYQNPQQKIQIVDCGLFSLDEEMMYKDLDVLKYGLDTVPQYDDICDSLTDLNAFKAGRYYHRTDIKSYFHPFDRWSRMFDAHSQIVMDYDLTGEYFGSKDKKDKDLPMDDNYSYSIFGVHISGNHAYI